VTNSSEKEVKGKKDLFWFMVSEDPFHAHLALLFLDCGKAEQYGGDHDTS
jgi:hypothetical protein